MFDGTGIAYRLLSHYSRSPYAYSLAFPGIVIFCLFKISDGTCSCLLYVEVPRHLDNFSSSHHLLFVVFVVAESILFWWWALVLLFFVMNVMTTHLQFRARYQTHKYFVAMYVFLYWSSHLLFKKTFLYRWSILLRVSTAYIAKWHRLWHRTTVLFACCFWLYVNLVTVTIYIYRIHSHIIYITSS